MFATLKVLSKGDFQSEAADIHWISQPSFNRMSCPKWQSWQYHLSDGARGNSSDQRGFLRGGKLPKRSSCHWQNTDSHHRNVWRWWAGFLVCRKGFNAINMQGIVAAHLKTIYSIHALRWTIIEITMLGVKNYPHFFVS